METGNHHNAIRFREEEQPVGKSMDSSPPKRFFHDRVVQGRVRYFLDGFPYRLSESLPQLRANA